MCPKVQIVVAPHSSLKSTFKNNSKPPGGGTNLCILTQVDPFRDVIDGGDPLEEQRGGEWTEHSS